MEKRDGYADNLGVNYTTIIKAKREMEAQQRAKYKVDSKERLKKIAHKKIQTTMIGALDTIEKHLGFLWEDDSKQSSDLREIYNIVRQEILDRGNDQIRNLDNELSQYDVEWLRYNLTLPIKRRTQDNG
jgi:transcription termination factor Rho